ncbi:Acyltransferase family [Yersinia pekkanenii]|uniref:Acyltransferase family n=1 Tax=Yersinia pekkanenii TaxID=1288385 RepID=A0A0T9Q678_9GAMM|nr:Acyltransferase family [Yersinia pekkanenii]CRY64327.1 Acyltransferase family [Yersinia pekkanenii]
MLFTRNETNYIKGIAIILMLMHHLFAFPERIPPDVNIINSFPFITWDIDNFIASFGKICVAMFLFISGYGYSFKNKISFKYSFNKLKKLYFSYWLVFIIFIPIGFLFVNNDWDDSSPIKLAKNIIGVSSDYNGEWWFIRLYVVYVLALPIISRLNSITLIFMALISLPLGYFSQRMGYNVISMYLAWLYPFISGYVFGKENKKIAGIMKHLNPPFFYSFSFLCIMSFFVTFKTYGLIVTSPLFVMLIKCIYNSTIHHHIINNLGTHSLYMWLTHSFFCYYYTPEIIYSVRYAPLILFLLILISYITSVILDNIEHIIKKLYVKLIECLSSHN